MFYYKHLNKYFFSENKYTNLEIVSEEEIKNSENIIYFLNKLNPIISRFSFSVTDVSHLFISKEDISLLYNNSEDKDLPEWLISKIKNRKIKSINTNYDDWINKINDHYPSKWKINIFALGDVGGTLLTGLRLIGGDYISEIGIYDRSKEKIDRYELEMNTVLDAFDSDKFPEVKAISYEELFDCDMFVFCASKGVPPVGSDATNVRMIQFEENSKIISQYAKLARDNNFKGIFSVVSDPVDPLCKVVFIESNKNEYGVLDFKGLNPEQIRGYGLGVMNARAIYYSKKNPKTINYQNEGRAFGPHGDGLIIANSIENYDDELSNELTLKAKTANLEVRKTGFKPYIAPALSSGSLSIISTISGKWHYSATYIGGVYMGAKNRLNKSGTELEILNLPDRLIEKIKNTHGSLSEII